MKINAIDQKLLKAFSLHMVWVNILQRVVWSPFFLLYNWDQVLQVDVKHSLSKWKSDDNDEPFDLDIFNAILACSSMKYLKTWMEVSGEHKKNKTVTYINNTTLHLVSYSEISCYLELENNMIEKAEIFRTLV